MYIRELCALLPQSPPDCWVVALPCFQCTTIRHTNKRCVHDWWHGSVVRTSVFGW